MRWRRRVAHMSAQCGVARPVNISQRMQKDANAMYKLLKDARIKFKLEPLKSLVHQQTRTTSVYILISKVDLPCNGQSETI